MDLLRHIHSTRRTTVVLVTHDAELAAMADARLVLRDGRVVERIGADFGMSPAADAAPRVPA
jgi:ABC-type lipoprotein export system ATPase subunit